MTPQDEHDIVTAERVLTHLKVARSPTRRAHVIRELIRHVRQEERTGARKAFIPRA